MDSPAETVDLEAAKSSFARSLPATSQIASSNTDTTSKDVTRGGTNISVTSQNRWDAGTGAPSTASGDSVEDSKHDDAGSEQGNYADTGSSAMQGSSAPIRREDLAVKGYEKVRDVVTGMGASAVRSLESRIGLQPRDWEEPSANEPEPVNWV